MSSRKIGGIIHLVFSVFFSVGVCHAENNEILGVFGFPQPTAETAVAIWTPLEFEESVYGILWYNNDAETSFPFLYAVAGDPDHPELLGTATVIGENLYGESSSWVEFVFDQPLSSSSSGLYFLFKFPENSNYEFPGEQGGGGLGFVAGDGIRRCWFTGDGENWDLFSPEEKIAAFPLISANKSGNTLLLDKPGDHLGIFHGFPSPIESDLSISNYPNPFNPSTQISFSLPYETQVRLAVFDLRGRLVRDLVNEVRIEGEHTIHWNGRGRNGNVLPSGVYFAKLTAGAHAASTRLTLLQ
jgi:hypothetical protein